MTIYSHSRLGAFENCPLSYKFHYIDGIRREGESVEAFLGSRYHDTMEKLYAELKFKTATVEELKNYFNEQWEEKWNDGILVVKKDRTEEDYKKIGLRSIEDYYKRHHPFKEGRVLGIEKRIMIDLDGTGKYRLRGYIDRLMETRDGHYEIHDYKTSGSLPEQSYLDSDRQLALYEIGVRAAWPDAKDIDLVWHYVTFDKEMRSRRAAGQLEELRSDIIALIDKVEAAEDFPPTESALCSWCDYQDICPLFAHKFKTETLPVNEYLKEDGVTLVNEYASMDAKKRNLNVEIKKIDAEQDKIREAVLVEAEKKKMSRLYGSDSMLTIKDDIKVNYPKGDDENRPEFEKCMGELDLWDVVTDVSWTSLKKIARDDEWYREVPEGLEDLVEVETTKRITLSKRKDTEDD